MAPCQNPVQNHTINRFLRCFHIEDAYAFSVLPAGYREGGSGKFYNDGEKAFFWSSAVRGSNANSADFLNFCNYMDTRSKYFHAMTYGHSVRCVKDE